VSGFDVLRLSITTRGHSKALILADPAQRTISSYDKIAAIVSFFRSLMICDAIHIGANRVHSFCQLPQGLSAHDQGQDSHGHFSPEKKKQDNLDVFLIQSRRQGMSRILSPKLNRAAITRS
jgi:hypothetical protein